jgi:flagellar hook-associated protein 2
MATISSLGTGSGLPLQALLSNLMTAEQTPLIALKTKEASYNARITSLGTLRSALDTLKTASAALVPATGKTASDLFAVLSAGVGDTSVASATASAGAVAGTFTMSGITLATAQQISKPGITVPASTGSLNIKVGTGAAVDVAIAAGSTLTQVSAAINNSTAGVTATVVNNGTTDFLMLTAKDTGVANTIAITGSAVADPVTGVVGTDWDSKPFDYPDTAVPSDWTSTTPTDASLTLNGIPITSASNTLTTAMTGVTINLLKAGSTTLTVTKNATSGLTSVLNAFVTAYNSAATTMSGLGTYNPTTQVAGALQGNNTLRDAQNQLRSQLFSSVGATSTSDLQRLSDIGLSIGKDGKLSLDTTKLNAAITTDFTSVANLVAAAGKGFQTKLEGITGTTGTIVTAIEGANSLITSNQRSQTALSARLTVIEARYRAQFTSLDTLVASMKNTSTYLTQQLDALTTLNKASIN